MKHFAIFSVLFGITSAQLITGSFVRPTPSPFLISSPTDGSLATDSSPSNTDDGTNIEIDTATDLAGRSIPEVSPIATDTGSASGDGTVTESETVTSLETVVSTQGTMPVLTIQSTEEVSATTVTDTAESTSTAAAMGMNQGRNVGMAMGAVAAVLAAL